MTTVQKWGGSLGVRIPKSIADRFGVQDGSKVNVKADEKGIFIEPADDEPTLEDLLAQCEGGNPHEEFFSRPMGREEI
ncbi:AbrB/MazE/SpoVT family DNA-binding domain-containing protein [Lentibacillus sp. CBA3610]|uniref:AbrB/MazE/SpoVT family DNA-binding domain-containing protein n=1 Tax=Lentibacillus sp. CBA3610 TaxID=2518176 RepID=UPI001595A1C9|nr:AbrB/MazE/SpoVT family DNA-binding domain-containing protein [Lentibacillus sp. CBA3610]QKY71165.1 AbrB/MazE/SpoVT family DNA-binding domain-containing protein [Lentibacillus sp. CBA3610]